MNPKNLNGNDWGYMKSILENATKGLSKEGSFIFEWHPCSVYIGLPGLTDEQYELAIKNSLQKENLFSSFVSVSSLREALRAIKNPEEKVSDLGKEMAEKIKKWIKFFAQRNIGKQDNLMSQLIEDFEFSEKQFWKNYLDESFLSFVSLHLGVEENTPYVLEYLKGLGLKNIEIKQTKSPINKRRDVWIISAQKA